MFVAFVVACDHDDKESPFVKDEVFNTAFRTGGWYQESINNVDFDGKEHDNVLPNLLGLYRHILIWNNGALYRLSWSEAGPKPPVTKKIYTSGSYDYSDKTGTFSVSIPRFVDLPEKTHVESIDNETLVLKGDLYLDYEADSMAYSLYKYRHLSQEEAANYLKEWGIAGE